MVCSLRLDLCSNHIVLINDLPEALSANSSLQLLVPRLATASVHMLPDGGIGRVCFLLLLYNPGMLKFL